MEAVRLLATTKTSRHSSAGTMIALAIAAAAAGWIASGIVHDRPTVARSFYEPDSSPPIGDRLINGPALVRSGGILLLSNGGECPLGSTRLSDVAIQVIKQRAEQYEITARRTADTTGWTGRTYKTCKI